MNKNKEQRLLFTGLGLIILALVIGGIAESTAEEALYNLSGLSLIIGIVLAGIGGYLLKKEVPAPSPHVPHRIPPVPPVLKPSPRTGAHLVGGGGAKPPPLRKAPVTPGEGKSQGAGAAGVITEAKSPVKLFVSYRRKDSMDVAGRLYDRLVAGFGKDAVFKDIDSIPVGSVFSEVLLDSLSQCDVVLVIIGRRWMGAKERAGKHRIWSDSDFVRMEVKTSLALDKTIIPVLVNDAPVPDSNLLPEDIRGVLSFNAARVRQDPDFHQDVDKLIQRIRTFKRADDASLAEARLRR